MLGYESIERGRKVKAESMFASDFGWRAGEWHSHVYFHDTCWLRGSPFYHNGEFGGYEYEDQRDYRRKLIVFND